MARRPLLERQIELGRALGDTIRNRRGSTPAADLAQSAGMRLDTLRKIEQGHVSTPGFFLVAGIADALGVELGELARDARSRLDAPVGSSSP